MASFLPRPLGARIPDLPHAVSCSLPTMEAVIGYEKKDPAVTRHLSSGYPRFVKHPFLREAADHALGALGRQGQRLWPTSSVRAAEALRAWLAPLPAEVVQHAGLSGVVFADQPEAFARAKTFLQHTGLLMSSREAEDYLVRVGLLAAPAEEPTFEGYAPSRIKGALCRTVPGLHPEDIFLANSGMNAIYAAFRAVSQVQATRGRRVWVQLGWLYLDTIALLRKFTPYPETDYVFQNDVFDLAGLERLFAARGHEIAGLITEVPTNPLIQSTDLPAVHALCRRHGVALIADPTIASLGNVHVLPHCDVLTTSLTKFAASTGDLTAGAVLLNRTSPWAAALQHALPGELEPLYSRDLHRLASQIGEMEGVVAQINRSTPRIVEFLRKHPKVASVHWSLHPDSAQNYLALARSPDSVGSLITFTVHGPVAAVYDRLPLAKGPSFGMKTTLICPFMYLAHFDLVTEEEGRAFLHSHGLHPELLRLSVGCEPVEELLEALRAGLD